MTILSETFPLLELMTQATERAFGSIIVQSAIVANGSESGIMTFSVPQNDVTSSILVLDGRSGGADEGAATINSSNLDVDLIVKDDNSGTAIFSEGSTGDVMFGGSAPIGDFSRFLVTLCISEAPQL